jgi:hypothetical protein
MEIYDGAVIPSKRMRMYEGRPCEVIGGKLMVKFGNVWLPHFIDPDGVSSICYMGKNGTECEWYYNDGRGKSPKSYFKE